jgi:hypothetical protein
MHQLDSIKEEVLAWQEHPPSSPIQVVEYKLKHPAAWTVNHANELLYDQKIMLAEQVQNNNRKQAHRRISS